MGLEEEMAEDLVVGLEDGATGTLGEPIFAGMGAHPSATSAPWRVRAQRAAAT